MVGKVKTRFKVGDGVRIIDDKFLHVAGHFQEDPNPNLKGKIAKVIKVSFNEYEDYDFWYTLSTRSKEIFKKVGRNKPVGIEVDDDGDPRWKYELRYEDVGIRWRESFLEPVRKTKKDSQYDKLKFQIEKAKVGDILFCNRRVFNYGDPTKVLIKIGDVFFLEHSIYGDERWFTLKELKRENVIICYSSIMET